MAMLLTLKVSATVTIASPASTRFGEGH